jgi:nicotinamide phosphoribosyltransferase
MLADSYKYSHVPMYPEGTKNLYDYIEARGGKTDKIVFFGLQYMLLNYFSEPLTMEEVEEAKIFALEHGIPFEYERFKAIITKCGGKLPIRIRAVKEGSIIPIQNPFLTIEATQEEFWWVVSWIETFIMKVWYPISVATKSHYMKLLIQKISNETGSGNVDFSYHNFGDRGSTTVEEACVGGMAHLISFKGTDNFHCIKTINDFYFSRDCGFSITASEHSTITSWRRENEYKMVNKTLEYNKYSLIMTMVGDSYNIFKFVETVTSDDFKTRIESPEYPKFIIRPDSGEPLYVIEEILKIMIKNNVEYDVNEKGYKVFKKYGILWGDGITPNIIEEILNLIKSLGFSSDIIAFGSGGDLMQNLNRDTHKLVMKCSAIQVGNEWLDVYKDPITDPKKISKKGKVKLFKDKENKFYTGITPLLNTDTMELELVFEDGVMHRIQNFENIREVYESYFEE